MCAPVCVRSVRDARRVNSLIKHKRQPQTVMQCKGVCGMLHTCDCRVPFGFCNFVEKVFFFTITTRASNARMGGKRGGCAINVFGWIYDAASARKRRRAREAVLKY